MLFNEQLESVETDLLATAAVLDGDQAEPEEEIENDDEAGEAEEEVAEGEESAEEDEAGN